jgi:hypothetical protein
MNNEIWLLEARIKYDLQYFDYIILTEANSTFSGLPKPFFYEKYSNLFTEYEDRIIYVKIDNLPKPEIGDFIGFNDLHSTQNCWIVEFEHRNRLQKEILKIAKPEDIVCIQDIDEIQNNSYLDNITNFQYINFLLYFNFKRNIINEPKETWDKAFITCANNLKQINIHDYRRIKISSHPISVSRIADASFRFKDSLNSVYDTYEAQIKLINKQNQNNTDKLGWHLSSMTHFIDKRLKWSCFSHQEFFYHFMKKNPENYIFDLESITDNIITTYLDKKSCQKHHYLSPSFIQESRFVSLFEGQT